MNIFNFDGCCCTQNQTLGRSFSSDNRIPRGCCLFFGSRKTCQCFPKWHDHMISHMMVEEPQHTTTCRQWGTWRSSVFGQGYRIVDTSNCQIECPLLNKIVVTIDDCFCNFALRPIGNYVVQSYCI